MNNVNVLYFNLQAGLYSVEIYVQSGVMLLIYVFGFPTIDDAFIFEDEYAKTLNAGQDKIWFKTEKANLRLPMKNIIAVSIQ